MKKTLLIIGGILILAIVYLMNFGIQIGDNIRIGKQNDFHEVKQKYDLNGSKFNTEYLENDQLVFVNLWATWCKPCIEEMPLLNAVKQKYASKNIQFVSLSIDTDSVKLVRFLESKKFEFQDITLDNLEYKTAILNFLDNKPADYKINSYVVPTSYLIKGKKIIRTFKGGFENESDLTSVIDAVL